MNSLTDFLKQGQVVVHLGAHKTATTYVQRTLDEERQRIEQSGQLQLVLPSDLRKQKVLVHPNLKGGADENAAIVNGCQLRFRDIFEASIQFKPSLKRICLSEESIMGTPRAILASGALYEDLRVRLQILPRELNHRNVTFLFATREYAQFFSSCMTTCVRRGKVFKPERVRRKLMKFSRSWLDVLLDISDTFPLAKLQVWDYADFKNTEDDVFVALTGSTIKSSQSTVFRTLSQDAMALLMSNANSVGVIKNPRQSVRSAQREHPISAENPPYMLFTPLEQEILSKKYLSDTQLCSQLALDKLLPS